MIASIASALIVAPLWSLLPRDDTSSNICPIPSEQSLLPLTPTLLIFRMLIVFVYEAISTTNPAVMSSTVLPLVCAISLLSYFVSALLSTCQRLHAADRFPNNLCGCRVPVTVARTLPATFQPAADILPVVKLRTQLINNAP